jgi:hypothetical protein
MVKSRTSWQHTPDSGDRIMDRLRWTGVQINVFMYERDGTHLGARGEPHRAQRYGALGAAGTEARRQMRWGKFLSQVFPTRRQSRRIVLTTATSAT